MLLLALVACAGLLVSCVRDRAKRFDRWLEANGPSITDPADFRRKAAEAKMPLSAIYPDGAELTVLIRNFDSALFVQTDVRYRLAFEGDGLKVKQREVSHTGL